MRESIQIRSIPCEYRAVDEGGDRYIDAYYAVFDSVYEINAHESESIDRHAFDETIRQDDIRCLIDHNTRLVLGRNLAGTFLLTIDAHGVHGRTKINGKDTDATNLYARVERGDVNQCSFGFEILEEEYRIREDGGVHWTVKKVRMHEGSICTFPAYQETSAVARSREYTEIKKRQLENWRANMMRRLKKYGAQTDENAPTA